MMDVINILKSEEKMIKLGLILTLTLLMTGLTSCSTAEQKNTEEISLKADRKLLDKYRAEIPEDIREENDFMALVLKDMAEVKMNPHDVRTHYYKEVRRKRDTFNKQHRKIREKFHRDAKKKRNEFLTNLKKERADFVASKPTSQESSEFFREQNTKRSAFFQDQSDLRKDFESEIESARRDFNDDMKLKQKQFDDAYREYFKNYQEMEKQKKMERQQAHSVKQPYVAPTQQAAVEALPAASYPGQAKDLQEFDNLKNVKRQRLGN
jgi:hypothetical protein